MLGKFVLVRTYSAGVHCGTLKEIHGTAALLTDCRRLWRWRGAKTLNEIALYGVDEEYSRISEPVETILLTEAIEVIPCTKKAQANLIRTRWGA